MAESLLLPVVREVAGKAADALVQSVTGMWGVDGDRDKLERQLLAVQCKLVDAEVKSETNLAIKRWMKALKAVAYEADDVLDEFQYEALRREAQIGESTTHMVLSYFTSHSPLLFRLNMSRKLNNVLSKINELVVEMNMFRLDDRAEAPQVLHRQTHSALDEFFIGRDDDKEVVVKLLLDQRERQKVQVLPIFGMGGLGKTTLAKMVYNDCRVQNHFELKMWHCVSDNFEAIALVKSIIELVTEKKCELSDTIEQLRKQLLGAIGKKRFLLVLDDVWNEEDRKWEDDLKPLLCYVGAPGSVILVTCRSQRVASIMSTLDPHKLACLSEDDSWKLFSEKAFGKGVEEKADLIMIGKRIVEKCNGLPLALKTMGGLMSSKQQVQEWEAIAESNTGDSSRAKDEILAVLKLSYRHLSSEMKQCFAFCAVFPQDYEMKKDILIQLWMANGFIEEEGTMGLQQKGEFIFNDLVWRSFLQDVKRKKEHYSDNVYSSRTPYESVCCKMHDLMHDLAKDVTDECATSKELIERKASMKDVRHMLMLTAALERNSGMLKGRAPLRTLLEKLRSHKDLKELRLVSIRVLRCYSPSIINSPVINAKHLRYLDLSESSFVTLPNSICLLYNLQSLWLNRCLSLKYLPEGMRTMRKLIHLYLFGCFSLERMPPNISQLNNLHTLTTFIVNTEDGRGIEELKEMRHLANRLELYNVRKIKSGQNAKEANLHQKQNLSQLLLCWGRTESDEPGDEACNEEEVLESLAPHSKLQILEVHGYGGQEISEWMRDPQMFRCLRKLTISNCPRCKDLPIVWLSVSLEYLCLRNMGGITTLCKSVEGKAEGFKTPLQIFPKLKEMVLVWLPNLESLTESSTGEPDSLVTFPILQVLDIYNCPKLPISSLARLTTLSLFGQMGEGTVSTSIPLFSWQCVVRLYVSSLANMALTLSSPNGFETAPSVPKSHPGLWECFAFVEDLEIRGCDELVCWTTEELCCFIRLRRLEIWYCDRLEGKGSSSEEILSLPQLEKLEIRYCGSLLEIPMLPASLECLMIGNCGSLVSLPSNLGKLTKLRDFQIWDCGGLKTLLDGMEGLTSLERLLVRECPGLKTLPDGMEGLTSLERLNVWDCPGIEKFPEGLLQRLRDLKSLRIIGCPDLERLCGQGGEYSHFICSIPDKYIVRRNNKKKKFIKRLLPSC